MAMTLTISFLVAHLCAFILTIVASDVNASSLIDCARLCQLHHGCFTFGFESDKLTCYLHKTGNVSDNTEEPRDVIVAGVWTCGTMSAVSRILVRPCSEHKWTLTKICGVDRGTRLSHCSELCSVLPDVTNALVSSGGQMTGSSRNYTCLKGYLDTRSLLTSAESTCLHRRAWSPVNLTCSGPFIRKSMSLQADCHYDEIPDRAVKGSSFSVLVKTCHDANFVLCMNDVVTHNSCYEVIIGGSKNKCIRIASHMPFHDLNVKLIHNLVSCTEFKPFWISWQNGSISVGKGTTVGNQIVIDAPMIDTRTKVGSVWYTCYINNNGSWLFLAKK